MTAPSLAAHAGPSGGRTTGVPDLPELVSVERPMMGGRVGIHLRPVAGDHLRAARDASTALDRLEAWASRLTRFDLASELSRLNASPTTTVSVSATLAAVLDWARVAEAASDGLVDVALLDARLAAEHAGGVDGPAVRLPANRRWSMSRTGRRGHIHRPAGLRFDLDGVAKGWLADRVLGLLGRYPAIAVDADGDVAVSLDGGEALELGIADPAEPGMDLAVLRLLGEGPGRHGLGVATSGTSVHRWGRGEAFRHHLIDPRTTRPAVTDVIQATVIAGSARVAEAFAKVAVIRGSTGAEVALRHSGVLGALLLTDDRRLIALPGTERFLA